MSWKYKFGQFVGIFFGVLAGSAIVNYAIKSLRPTAPPQQYGEIQSSLAPQNNLFIYDQVVSNVAAKPAVTKIVWCICIYKFTVLNLVSYAYGNIPEDFYLFEWNRLL